MRWNVLPYLFFLLAISVQADPFTTRQLQGLDSHSRLLCASALLYFDPRDPAPDPRLLTAVFHHLTSLETDALQLGQPEELMQPLAAMRNLFEQLEHLPRRDSRHYPELVGRLLEQRHKLGEASQRHLAEAPGEQPFGEQSRDLAVLLLDYQLRHYPLVQTNLGLLASDRRSELDGAIEQRFELLQSRYPAQQEALAKVHSSYRFVRPQLQQEGGVGSSGVEFYLSRAVLDLDEMALVLAP